MAITGPSVKYWRILLLHNFTAHKPLLTATSTFGLGRRHQSSCQQCTYTISISFTQNIHLNLQNNSN